MSLTLALQNAVSGLQYSQTTLNTISNNIANANTEGYTRKTVDVEARTLAGQGAGVNVTGLSRSVSQGLLSDLRIQISAVENLTYQSEIFGRMQDMFGSLASGSDISSQINDLEQALEVLATTPESEDARIAVINEAQNLVNELNSMAASVQKLRLEADQTVGASVTRVNELLGQIDQLNRQIADAKGNNRVSVELEDQRDQAMSDLAKEIDYSFFVRDTGEAVILTKTGRTLLDGFVRPLSHATASQMDQGLTLGSGIDGIFLGGVDITAEITDGRMAGAIRIRDQVLPNFGAQLDNLTVTIRDEINAVHNTGAGHPAASTLTGTRVFGNTANDIFSGTGTVRLALVDQNGNYAPGTPPTDADFYDLDLTALGPVSIDALAADINANLTNINATIVNGQLVLEGSGGFRVAIDDQGSEEVTTGRSFSHYFGLNDFFVSGEVYSAYESARQTAATTPVGSDGQLTISFAGMTAAATVNYTSATTLTTLATDITTQIAAQGGNATASVVSDGDGVRLVISDPDGDELHFAETGGGSAYRDLGLGTRDDAISTTISLRSDIASNPSLISRGQVSSATPTVGGSAISAGDNRTALALAAKFSEGIVFGTSGGIATTNTTFSGFGATMVSLNASQAQLNDSTLDFQTIMRNELSGKVSGQSGVNVDEELANMTVFQNAYAANARVISVTAELLEILVNLGR